MKTPPDNADTPTCAVASCPGRPRARGLCMSHYHDWWQRTSIAGGTGWTVGANQRALVASINTYVASNPRLRHRH